MSQWVLDRWVLSQWIVDKMSFVGDPLRYVNIVFTVYSIMYEYLLWSLVLNTFNASYGT